MIVLKIYEKIMEMWELGEMWETSRDYFVEVLN